MGEGSWRDGLRWALGLLLILYLAAGLTGEDDDPPESDDAVTVDRPDDDRIQIVRARPSEVAPGGALVLELGEALPSANATLNGHPLEVVTSREREWVFRVPEDFPEGDWRVQIEAGDRTSDRRMLEVKRPRRRKGLRNALGGLALVVLGIRTLARGVRRRVGADWRRRLARLSGNTARGVIWGALAGGVTQTGPTVAALTVSALGSKLIALGGAVTVMIGAQLGASVVGSLLPLAASREALIIVALGVAWLTLARDRRGRAAGELVLGAGLLFHGLYLLRVGLAPLMDAPAIMDLLSQIDAASWGGRLLCAAIGAFLCAILQGPGPVFFVVLGLVQSTNLLGLEEAVAILGGTPLGTGIAAAMVAWPYGGVARRFGNTSLKLAAGGSLVILVTLPAWIALAAALLGTDPNLTTFGKKIIHPAIGPHLILAFITSQLAATLAAALAARAIHARGSSPPPTPKTATAEVADALALLPAYGEVLDACRQVTARGERESAAAAERQLLSLESRRRVLGQADARTGAGEILVAIGHLHRTCRELLRSADLAVEAGVRLSADDQSTLDRVASELRSALTELAAPDGGVELEDARAREIRINAIEAESRRAAAGRGLAGVEASALVGAYEAVGNQVFRLAQVISQDD